MKKRMPDDEFVPYDLSLQMKELGFNYSTFAYSTVNKKKNIEFRHSVIFVNHNSLEHRVSNPLFQQAFEWFRENKKLMCQIEKGENSENYYPVIDGVSHKFDRTMWFDTYRLGELACIKKLIELVKEQNDDKKNTK